jgi:pimeloyl-ACP methyl ester carboxylesterase
MPLSYLLVHGSWQGGWCWDGVRSRLEARGHRVLAPTLPGHADPSGQAGGIAHADYVAVAEAALETADEQPVMLVGHSFGGAVITQLADRRPERIARLVYVAAFVPRDGESVGDILPPEFRAGLEQLGRARPDRAVALPWELWRSAFMQTNDEQTARRAYARLVPEPWAPIFEPVRLSYRASPAVPAAFVVFRHDRTMPPGYWHPQMTSRLETPEIIELDGDHEAMLTAPDRLAEALPALASDAPAHRVRVN